MIRIMSKTRGAVSLYITKRGHGLLRINHSTSIVSTVSKQISKEELFSTAPRTLAQHLPTMIPLQPVAYPTEDNGVAGRSLLASHFIPKGVEIMAETFRAGSKHIQKQPSRFSLRKEDGVHLVVESIIRFTNHRWVCLIHEFLATCMIFPILLWSYYLHLIMSVYLLPMK